jgi:tRNA (guanine-N7-)-methyltransferase
LLPRVAIGAGAVDLADWPFRAGGLYLEIGFGDGERLVHRAKARPDAAFLGCEPFVNGVAKLLASMEREQVGNIRIHAGDARELLDRLPDACLDGVDLFYPDPWPKRRHRKRRFVSDESLSALAVRMKPQALLRFASDIDDYTGWTLARVARSPDFTWLVDRPADWRIPWPDWQSTRYERKAFAEGREGAYLTFRRR